MHTDRTSCILAGAPAQASTSPAAPSKESVRAWLRERHMDRVPLPDLPQIRAQLACAWSSTNGKTELSTAACALSQAASHDALRNNHRQQQPNSADCHGRCCRRRRRGGACTRTATLTIRSNNCPDFRPGWKRPRLPPMQAAPHPSSAVGSGALAGRLFCCFAVFSQFCTRSPHWRHKGAARVW